MKENDFYNELQSEVKDISPLLEDILSKIKKKSIMDGYFEKMQQSVLDQMNGVQSEINDISPVIAGTLIRPQKEVPDAYFEIMQASVLEKINARKSEARIVSLKNRSNARVWLAAASAVGVLFISIWFLFNKAVSQPLDLSSLDQSEISEYLLNHAEDLDDDHLGLLQSTVSNADLLELDDTDLKPILDEYLYQMEKELN